MRRALDWVNMDRRNFLKIAPAGRLAGTAMYTRNGQYLCGLYNSSIAIDPKGTLVCTIALSGMKAFISGSVKTGDLLLEGCGSGRSRYLRIRWSSDVY